MRIIGIDPGSRYTGYGILEEKNGHIYCLGGGCITLAPSLSFAEKLGFIYKELKKIMDDFAPHEMVVEEIFFARNVKSALKLAHVRGVILLLSVQAGIPLREYSPLEVKQSVVGYGRATKEQVQQMVNRLLRFKDPLPYDQTDALALAFCRIHRNPVLDAEFSRP